MRTFQTLSPYLNLQAQVLIRAMRDYSPEKPKTRELVLRAFFHFMNFYEEEYGMAKSNGENTAFGNFKFASVTLTSDDKASYETWAAKIGTNLLSEVAELVSEGWKTSITWDNDNDCFIASLTCRAEKHKNENVVVVSRSDDMLEALALGIYKITVLFKGKALPTEKIKQNWG